MSHCPGCGGHFKHGGHKDFKHLLGCGWVFDKPDGRGAPSKARNQEVFIQAGLDAAAIAKSKGEDEVDAFVAAVLEELEKYNRKP